MGADRDRWTNKLLMAGLPVYDLFRPAVYKLQDVTWEWRGRPYPPPPLFKQRTVLGYGERFHLDVFVETGTFLGDMVKATTDHFVRVISIELDARLYARAERRFAPCPHVTVLQGSSGRLLPQVLAAIDRPTLFWLDAHYSGSITARGAVDTPIVSELQAILCHRVTEHVILIDDARVFNGRNDYPDIATVRDLLLDRRPGWHWEVKDDIMRFHPAATQPDRLGSYDAGGPGMSAVDPQLTVRPRS